MKVSVVIPTYNRADVLRRCLRSLMEQTYPKNDYEVIVADDGSTDGTPELVAEFQRQGAVPVKYLRQANRGVSAARNLGIRAAQGDIIGIIDSDAFARGDWLQQATDYLAKETDIAGVEGKVVATGKEDSLYNSVLENLDGGLYLGCNIFFRKAVLEAAGEFDERLLWWAEDTDMAFRILKAGHRLVFSSEVVVYHPVPRRSPWEPIKRCRSHYYSLLLRKQHPDMPNPHPLFWKGYALYIAMVLGGVAGVAFQWWPVAALSFLGWAAIYAHILRRFINFRGAKGSDAAKAALALTVAPFVHYYELGKAYLRLRRTGDDALSGPHRREMVPPTG